MRYVVKHAKTDLWIAERAGSMARWGSREEAMALTREEWDAALNPENMRWFVFEPVPAKDGGV